jgi:hypothetical protein
MAKPFSITVFLYHHYPQHVHVSFCLTVRRQDGITPMEEEYDDMTS